VLTWRTPYERNRLLGQWRLAVCNTFGEQARCLRVGWALHYLFNIKTGYAYPSNSWLANQTGMAENKLRATLLVLEEAHAIIRSYVVHNGRKQRVIYPARGILPRPTVGHGGEPQQVGHHNKRRKRARVPKSEHERALLAYELTERRNSERAAQPVSNQGDDVSRLQALPPAPSERKH
jgi:hypothetical protein